MSANVVADLLHLAHGVAPAERSEVVASLARLDGHLRSFPDGTVKLQLSVKERDTASQRTTLEAWVPGHPPIVATSQRNDFPAAMTEVRDEMVRQLTELKERTQARNRGARS